MDTEFRWRQASFIKVRQSNWICSCQSSSNKIYWVSVQYKESWDVEKGTEHNFYPQRASASSLGIRQAYVKWLHNLLTFCLNTCTFTKDLRALWKREGKNSDISHLKFEDPKRICKIIHIFLIWKSKDRIRGVRWFAQSHPRESSLFLEPINLEACFLLIVQWRWRVE